MLNPVYQERSLSCEEMEWNLEAILKGEASEEEIVDFLTFLRNRGETLEEIKGAVLSLRRHVLLLPCKTKNLLDTCGTGGDKKNSFNISTAVAFVVAGAGIPVAKHGNRAVSSRSGSADVLKACGVNVEAPPDIVARCVDEIGIGFLFAPLYHPALKAVSSARKKIGTRTLFNIIGPLLNPVSGVCQVVGVYDRRLTHILADVLRDVGTRSAAIVYGEDGMDEITLAGKSIIVFLKDGMIHEEVFDPLRVGYSYCNPDELQGGDPLQNAQRLKKTLKGHSQAIDHCVHLNAALAICVSGKTDDMREALLMAQESISSGRAFEKLEQLIEMTTRQ